MKILLVITHGNIGGATNMVCELARGFRAAGHDVTVGFGEGAYLEGKLAGSGASILRFPHLRRTRNPISLLLFIDEMRRVVAQGHFDVVQCNSSNTLPGLLGVKLARRATRTVFTVHGLSMLSKNHGASALAQWAYRIFFRFFLLFVDIPVFVSRRDLAEARALNLVRNGEVIHNGIDPSKIEFLPAAEARRELGRMAGRTLEGTFLIGSIGRLSPEKNYEFVIHAVPDILKIKKDALFMVIGEGKERDMYTDAARKERVADRVLLPGEVADAARYLRAFDLFLLPSRFEGLPVTVIECLMARVPVIASDVGGNREILPASSLYPLDDRKEFLRAFKEMVRNPEVFLPSPDHREEFASRRMIEHYLTLFRQG